MKNSETNHACIKINLMRATWIFIMALSALLLQSSAKQLDVRFIDVTRKSGVDFIYTFGDYHYENILESSGSGVTVFDYNNDGLMDLFMMNGTYIYGVSDEGGELLRQTPDRLYRNDGRGRFTEVSEAAGLNDTIWSMAAGAIDYDNDGDEDLFLLNYGPNRFFRNNGDGTFSDITGILDLRGPEKLNGFEKWSIGVSFWDHNLDGRLDAMVGNFLAFDPEYFTPATPDLMPHPSEYRGQASILYEQDSTGRFVDVTEANGLFYPDSKCMGLTVFDYDDDGDIDIFQANDHQLNFMFRNDDGVYSEVGVEIGVAANTQGKGSGSMHGSIGDVDGDGLIDILVVDLEYGALYRNRGNGLFEDISETSGISGPLAGKGAWAAAFIDFDNDGDLDIVSANGTAEELILQYPLLLENDGTGHFKDRGKVYGPYFSTKRSGRGLAVWDYDNDGDRDVIISHVDLTAKASLLRNDGGNSNHWIGISLRGKNSPASAIAAKVVVTAGGKRQVHINQWSTSYLSNNDPRVHIGLGNSKTVDRLEIHWTGGGKEIFENIAADRYLKILEGSGIVEEAR
jgi:hypothetical protein